MFAAGLADTHAVSLGVKHFGPTQVFMVAGLLRHQIRCIVFGRGALENAELATVQTVVIGFLGAKAVEAQVLVLLGKCPFQSECRQRRRIGGTGISGGQMYTSAGGIHLIAHGNLGFARFGQRMTNAVNGHQPRWRHSSFQDTAIADACRLRVEYVLVKAAHGFLDAA